MIMPGELLELARSARMVEVTLDDRIEFGRSLITQGYTPDRAAELMQTIPCNDAALQMLARHRIRYSMEVARG